VATALRETALQSVEHRFESACAVALMRLACGSRLDSQRYSVRIVSFR
jgi:hypothetical protein